MLLSTLVVGCVAAYYFGLRPGAYAAGVTLLLSVVAIFVPRYALAIQLCIAAGTVVLWRVGSRRPRPADAALAVRYVRRTIERLIS